MAIRKLVIIHLVSLFIVGVTFVATAADAVDERHVLVMSMLLTDGIQEHVGIRGFYTLEECDKYVPAYQELISMFNNPGNVVQSALTCYPIESKGE